MGPELVFPPFRLDVANEQLWREERLLALRPKTFAILRYLAEHSGRLVTKEQLLRAVWGETLVSEDGLRDYVREIRQALGDDPTAPRFVETARGRGYRFIASVGGSPNEESQKEKRAFSSLIPSPQHLEPPLVGRDADLAHLQGWLEKALNGERQLVFVTGEPGIGKTALVEAFLAGMGQRRSGKSKDKNRKPNP